jgi:hypothetical protein
MLSIGVDFDFVKLVIFYSINKIINIIITSGNMVRPKHLE